MAYDAEVFMNYAFMVVGRRNDLNATQFAIYLILAGWALPESGVACVPQRALCVLMGLDPDTHRTTVARSIKTLERLGLIRYVGKHDVMGTSMYEVVNYKKYITLKPLGNRDEKPE